MYHVQFMVEMLLGSISLSLTDKAFELQSLVSRLHPDCGTVDVHCWEFLTWMKLAQCISTVPRLEYKPETSDYDSNASSIKLSEMDPNNMLILGVEFDLFD